MKIPSTICYVLLLCMDFSAQNALSEINKTADNALKVLNLLKGEKSGAVSVSRLNDDESEKNNSSSQKKKICREFCVENLSKKNAKVEIEYQSTGERETLLVMSKDKSCLFDIPLGVYTIRVYQDERLTKKTDFRVEDSEQEMIKLPE